MPRSVNGIGTAYRSVGEPDEEGWRDATVWLIFLDLPLLPLKRDVLRPSGSPTVRMDGETLHFEILESGLPRFVEVLQVYFINWVILVPGIVLLFGFGTYLVHQIWADGDNDAGIIVGGFICGIVSLFIASSVLDGRTKRRLTR